MFVNQGGKQSKTQDRSGDCTAQKTAIEAVKNMSAPEQRDVGPPIQRDLGDIKAFWDEVRGKLWIGEEEVFPVEEDTASELSTVSNGVPFGDGMRTSAALQRFVGDC